MAERLLGARVVVLGAAALLAMVVALALADQPVLGAIGPGALCLVWLPLALWAWAAAADRLGRPRAGALLALGARVAVWVVLVALLADPHPNAPDVAAAALHAGVAYVGSAVRTVVAALVGIIVLGGLAAILLGGGSNGSTGAGEPRPAAVRTGSSLGPIAALLLRLVARLALVAAVAIAWTLLVLGAWTARGVLGVAIALGIREPVTTPDFVLARVAGLFGRVGTGVTDLLARRASTWGRRQVHGVWIAPASIERGANGELVAEVMWPETGGETDEVRELRELAVGLLNAYDVGLVSGTTRMRTEPQGGADPRNPAPRAYPYRLEVARAWSRPAFHGVVLRATPSTANALLARVTVEQLLPTLDAETSWTAGELRGLRLSDPRVAADPLRAGERGIFVALDRVTRPEHELAALPADPGRAAIERALREAALVTRFTYHSEDDGFDADVFEFRANFSTSAEWRELETAWRGLQPAVSLFSRNPGAKLEARLEPYGFVCTLPKESPAFPSGEATDWMRVVTRMEPVLRRRRLGFVLGLDHRGEPLVIELGAENPHLLLAGATGSGKSRSGLFSPLAQLIRLNDPSHLRVWILDSVKRELSSLFGDAPHVDRVVIAEDGADVVATLEAFTALMDARYRDLSGRAFDPSRDSSYILALEEWADLRLLLEPKALEAVTRAVSRIGQLGRAAGFHLILVLQRPTAEVLPPAIKSAFKLRASGFMSQASEFGSLFDIHKRLLPNVKGRLCISDGVAMTVVQGLYASNEVIRDVVTNVRDETSRPHAPVASPLDAIEPRAPTAREVEGLELLTLARLIYRWQAEVDEPLIISVRSMVDRVRALGFTPGRVERYTAGLAELEARGVLERTGEGPQSPRRLTGADWSWAAAAVS